MQQEMLKVNDDEIEINDDQIYLYQGIPFTGIACEYRNGKLASEYSYVNGMEDGLIRAWHDNGQLSLERYCRKGRLHGLNREWDENGVLREESLFESGYRVELKEWDENGRLMNHHVTNESDPEYSWLQRARGIPQNQGA